MPLTIQTLKLHPGAQLPRYAHTGPYGDLAADLHAVSAWTIEPGETVAIPTGLALGFPPGFGALVEDRSGLALRGLTTLAGVIDPIASRSCGSCNGSKPNSSWSPNSKRRRAMRAASGPPACNLNAGDTHAY
jgi:hypothetical protein